MSDSKALIVRRSGLVKSVGSKIAITEKLLGNWDELLLAGCDHFNVPTDGMIYEAITSTNRSLVRRKGLVKRGLDLIPGLKRQQVRVQIGNFDVGTTEFLSNMIKKVIKDKYDLKLGSSFYGEELIDLAENAAIDIFILIINNIRFRPDYPVQERLENSLQMIIKIKTTTGRPVIALSGGLTEDSPLIAKAKRAADFYFPLPCKPEVLMEAFEKCLDMLPGFVEVP